MADRDNCPSTAVLLFSLSSSRPEGSQSLIGHAERMRSQGGFAGVETAYAGADSAAFLKAAASLAESGAKRVVAVPYFLGRSHPVREELPARLAEAGRLLPAIEFLQANPIGYAEAMAEAVLEAASEAEPLVSYCGKTASAEIPIDSAGTRARKTALLLMAHGSRRSGAADEIQPLAASQRLQQVYPIVQAGFLEHCTPAISQAVAACAALDAGTIYAVPCFLHDGKHTAADLPRILCEAQQSYPAVRIMLAKHIGRSAMVTRILIQRAREAV